MQICSFLPLRTRYSIVSLITLPGAREGISYLLTAKRSHTLRLTLAPGLPAAAQLPGRHKGEGISPESLDCNEAPPLFHPNRRAFLLLESPPSLRTLCSWHSSSSQELNVTCVSPYQSAAPTLRKEYVQKLITPVLTCNPAPKLLSPLFQCHYY